MSGLEYGVWGLELVRRCNFRTLQIAITPNSQPQTPNSNAAISYIFSNATPKFSQKFFLHTKCELTLFWVGKLLHLGDKHSNLWG
jgi:hypothetical protein